MTEMNTEADPGEPMRHFGAHTERIAATLFVRMKRLNQSKREPITPLRPQSAHLGLIAGGDGIVREGAVTPDGTVAEGVVPAGKFSFGTL